MVPLLSRAKESAGPGGDALHGAGRDLRERAPYTFVRERSFWLEAQKRPELTAAAVAGAGALLWLTLKGRRALRDHAIRRDERARLRAREV